MFAAGNHGIWGKTYEPLLRGTPLPLKPRRLTGGIAPPTVSGLPNLYLYSSYRAAASVTIGAFT
ncbi:MAG TPA: hypothetical protein VIS31_10110 [Woeseiaceae bacterium]